MPKERIKLFLVPVISCFIGLGTIIFVLVPVAEQVNLSRLELEKAQQRVERLSAKVSILNQTDETQTRNLYQSAASALPTDKNIPGLLAGLERAAQAASASVEGFSISPGKVGTVSGMASESAAIIAEVPTKELGHGVKGIAFRASLKGSYQALRAFIDSIYKSNRLIGIEGISMAGSKTSDSDVSSGIDFYVYFQPDTVNLGEYDREISLLTPAERKQIEVISSYPVFTSLPPLVPVGKSNPFTR